MLENWVEDVDVKIHYIDSNPTNLLETPLLICPGLSEPAENYTEVMSLLQPRRCITFANRGRGKSSSPVTGYSLEHHVRDIEVVVKELKLENFFLLGYSRGVSYALGYAVKHSNSLKGLILAEYPAEHKEMPFGWAEDYLNTYWGNTLGSNLMEQQVVMGIEKESKKVDFRNSLVSINCPTLIMRGVLEESLLSEAEANLYLDRLNKAKLEEFLKSGHTLKESETEKFVNSIKEFLVEVE
ncbi:alpha/beta hydrolase [Cytobacillus suaedae]|nr:alpha/beta hydrolase [Cytobacillus suaedae]